MDIWNQITVTDIESVFTVHAARGHRLNMKSRKNYALSFAVGDAKIIYTKDGKRYVSDAKHAVLLPMGGDYQLLCQEAGDFPLINFTSERFTDDFIVVPLQNADLYRKDYERLRVLQNAKNNRAKAISILYGIFSRLAHEEESRFYLPIRHATDYISAHLSDQALSAKQLSAVSGLSEVYFRRLFKAAYGIPPKQYILDLRIRHAQLLLNEANQTVTEIAEACGFSSVYHFCRTFKSITGETPTEYRKKEIF